jgi:hypothetical protein
VHQTKDCSIFFSPLFVVTKTEHDFTSVFPASIAVRTPSSIVPLRSLPHVHLRALFGFRNSGSFPQRVAMLASTLGPLNCLQQQHSPNLVRMTFVMTHA